MCTGDVLDRGEDDPDEVLDELLRRGVRLLAGNHELAYLGGPTFAGMADGRSHVVRERLRELALDGKLRAAAAVGDVLCCHGGITRAFWERHLRTECGSDVTQVASTLNRWFLRGIARRDLTHPIFASMADPMPGPFWAHLEDDVLAGGTPPFRQAVGHVVTWPPGWRSLESGGSVFPLDWGAHHPDGSIGHLVMDETGDWWV